MKYYLVGGGDIKAGKLKKIDSNALTHAKNKFVYVLDLSTNDKNKLEKYREFLSSYFKDLGATKIEFISTAKSSQEIKEELNKAGIIYIPGGDTEILLNNIKRKKIVPLLKGLEAIIIGNSAGALALGNETILTKDEDTPETKVIKGLSLLDFAVEVHYKKEKDKELAELSKKRKIYAIPENCAILFDGKFHYIGNIYKFSNGKKTKLN